MLSRGNVPLKLSSTCNHYDNNRSRHIFAFFEIYLPTSAIEHTVTKGTRIGSKICMFLIVGTTRQ